MGVWCIAAAPASMAALSPDVVELHYGVAYVVIFVITAATGASVTGRGACHHRHGR